MHEKYQQNVKNHALNFINIQFTSIRYLRPIQTHCIDNHSDATSEQNRQLLEGNCSLEKYHKLMVVIKIEGRIKEKNRDIHQNYRTYITNNFTAIFGNSILNHIKLENVNSRMIPATKLKILRTLKP